MWTVSSFISLALDPNTRKKMTANPMSCSKEKSDDNKGMNAMRSIEHQNKKGRGEKIPSDSPGELSVRTIVASAMMQQRGDGQLSTSPPSLAIRHVRVTTPSSLSIRFGVRTNNLRLSVHSNQ